MKLRYLLMLIPVLTTGCASTVALIDSQEALAVVDATNVENWVRVRRAKIAECDQGLADFERTIETAIAKAATGKEAAVIFKDFQDGRLLLSVARANAGTQYDKALDNAFLAQELRDRQRRIMEGWWNLITIIPGMDTASMVAEAKAREYVKRLSKLREGN